jgi:methylmalonyl-CoA mutase
MPIPNAPLFSPTTKADWLRQVQRDLKDELALERLRWQTPDGFVMEPYYTDDSGAILSGDEPQMQNPSGGEPRGVAALHQKNIPGWLNAPEPTLTNSTKTDNATLRNALDNGADALVLTVTDTTDLTRLLDGIKLSTSPVFFRIQAEEMVNQLIANLKQIAPYQLKGGLLFDPVAYPQPPTDQTRERLAEATRQTLDSPRFGTVCADGSQFHNAGATASQELAFVLSSLAEQYDWLTDNGFTMSQLVPKTIISLSVGTSYFMEIAKLRALKVLWHQFIGHWPLVIGDWSLVGHYPLIHCQTSVFQETTASPYTNLLRATTEAMAAVIGGCDALTVRPYDAATGQIADQPTDFSARIARNVSNLLRHESYFSVVTDPAKGSYYVETLTAKLTQTAWALFLEIENQGGLAKATESGFVLAELTRSYEAQKEAIANGQRVVVGVTKFQS